MDILQNPCSNLSTIYDDFSVPFNTSFSMVYLFITFFHCTLSRVVSLLNIRRCCLIKCYPVKLWSFFILIKLSIGCIAHGGDLDTGSLGVNFDSIPCRGNDDKKTIICANCRNRSALHCDCGRLKLKGVGLMFLRAVDRLQYGNADR